MLPNQPQGFFKSERSSGLEDEKNSSGFFDSIGDATRDRE
jgi:hypothetical protein